MNPIRVNAWAWAQIVQSATEYLTAIDEVDRSEQAIHGTRGNRRKKAARRIYHARNDRDALARSLASQLVAADLPEGVGVAVAGMTVWFEVDNHDNITLGSITTATIEPVGGY